MSLNPASFDNCGSRHLVLSNFRFLPAFPIVIRAAVGPSSDRHQIRVDFAAFRQQLRWRIILGKTNVPTNLQDYQVQGEIYPEGKNPHRLECSPGGSTGGGAAAIAASMTPMELGIDGGGSLRIPAHFCGVFCLMPTDKMNKLFHLSEELTSHYFSYPETIQSMDYSHGSISWV